MFLREKERGQQTLVCSHIISDIKHLTNINSPLYALIK